MTATQKKLFADWLREKGRYHASQRADAEKFMGGSQTSISAKHQFLSNIAFKWAKEIESE
ncbi:MAG: hypothetical protein ACRD33_00045 [Candidatus Acidiferrales bacterium]